MAIRTVAVAEAPQRMFKRGTVSNKQDYSDVLAALPKVGKDQAMIIDMDAKAWEGVKKAETTFASNLRRLFEARTLPLTAYQSGTMQITIRKATALDKASAGGRKKKE